jgi:hypothetical protein
MAQAVLVHAIGNPSTFYKSLDLKSGGNEGIDRLGGVLMTLSILSNCFFILIFGAVLVLLFCKNQKDERNPAAQSFPQIWTARGIDI